MANDLPEEVIREILCRLPPDSLIRFKSVNKSWYDLINHPIFVAQNLLNSNSNSILLKPDFLEENILSFLTYHPNNNTDVVLYDIDLPCSSCLEICGHSHGLVCLSNHYHKSDIFLCNPVTRVFRQLPPSIILRSERPSDPVADYSVKAEVGFGYDPNSQDFKVVRIMHFVESPPYKHPIRVEVYNLSTDQWREITTPMVDCVVCAPSFEMHHNGVYYWLAIEEHDYYDQEIILSFDMSKEVFSSILLPGTFGGYEYNCSISMGVRNESIVIFYYQKGVHAKFVDCWAMEKGESGGISWSKLLTIGPVLGIENPLLFFNSDELLMVATDGEVVSYNVNTQEFISILVKGHPRNLQGFLFTKGLLSVKGGSRFDFESASKFKLS